MDKKILVVEDDASLNRALVEFLTEEKFEIESALDGEKGLELAASAKPDLILLDIVLPIKDGYEVLEALKKDEKTKRIPVILLNNLESQEDIMKAFEKGASTYLVKANYKLEEIVKKIKETLRIK